MQPQQAAVGVRLCVRIRERHQGELLALEDVRHLYRRVGAQVPIVGVGGIDSPEEAYRRIRAGATLVELYTGLVYEGPGLIPRTLRRLVELLDRDGLERIQDAVGLDG